MSALDYRFLGSGFSLRLTGRCRSGWTEGQFGQFYRGVCTFDWKFGHRCRAQVSAYPQNNRCTLDVVETLTWSARDESACVNWSLADGVVVVELPIVITEPVFQLNPTWRSTGHCKATISHTSRTTIGGHPVKFDLVIFIKWDADHPDIVAWAKGTGMASAGLPSLGKRR